MTCSVCGQPLPAGARFCPHCGAVVGELLETEERKLVTVLFADLVDSTGLSRRLDPERAREVLGSFFDAASEELQALRGHPEKFIGDAVMAVFGVPHVHEDDALRAVRAGLAIRGRVRRLGRQLGLAEPLEVRVGVESGEAATGRGPAGQLLVTGPVVNMAARLQTSARPDQVLAGPTTRALTDSAVTFGPGRRIRARGFDRRLSAFPVEQLTTRSARRTIPFVGRSGEQAVLRQSFDLASSTGRPVLATVIGEPGIGKTRLADELVAGLGSEVAVLHGVSRSYVDTATFAPAAAIVRELAGVREGGSPETLRRRLRELAAGAGEPAEAGRTADRLGMLFALAETQEESAYVPEVQAGFLALVDGLARDAPVVLVFDDVHALAAPMLDLIERLGARPRRGRRRALVMALARDQLLALRPSWGAGSGNAVLIRLEPLSSEESVELVRQAGGGRIEDAQAARIAARAGGNPYFIIETTGMLVTDGRQDGAASLPPTVQAVVAARLDALPPRLRELARRAAVFLYGFDLEELAVVDEEATAEELRQLEDAEILIREQASQEEPYYRLRHATLREVAYGSLPKRERLRLHLRVADALQEAGHPRWAADHLERAAIASLDLDPNDRTVVERAASGLVVAGDRARRRMESRAAVDAYERALALAGAEPGWGVREARALAGMGEARYWLGEYPAAADALTRAVALGEEHQDQVTLALALRFLGDIAINVEADLDKAQELLDRALTAAEATGDRWAIARALIFAGWVPWTREEFESSEAIWRRVLEIADPKDRWSRVRALTALSINQRDMDPAGLREALRLVEEAGALAEDGGDQFNVGITAVQKGRVFGDLGQLEAGLHELDRGIAIFAELGARWELADATAERGIIKRELGRLDEAEDDLQQAIRMSDELGERQLAGWTWRALARVAERRGDPALAEERYRRAREAQARGPGGPGGSGG